MRTRRPLPWHQRLPWLAIVSLPVAATVIQQTFAPCRGLPYFMALTALFVLIFTSMLNMVAQMATNWRRAAVPLAINLVALFVLFSPAQVYWHRYRFSQLQPDYPAALAWLESNRDTPPGSEGIALPDEFAYLSPCTGSVLLDEAFGGTRVFFTHNARTSYNFAGYLFQPDDAAAPDPLQFDWNGAAWQQLPADGWVCHNEVAPGVYYCTYNLRGV